MSIHTLTATTTLKNTGYVGAFFASLEFVGLAPVMLWLLSILMIIDVLAGIHRVYKNHGGGKIESRLLRKGVIAKMMLLLIILGIGVTSKIVGFDAHQYVQGAISIIALGEMYSIVGNVHSARTGVEKVEFDAVAFLLRKLRDILDKYVK